MLLKMNKNIILHQCGRFTLVGICLPIHSSSTQQKGQNRMEKLMGREVDNSPVTIRVKQTHIWEKNNASI